MTGFRYLIAVSVLILSFTASAAEPTVQAVFMDERGFCIAAIEDAEFPYYLGHTSQNRLFPIYLNENILGGVHEYSSQERNILETITVLLQMPSAARLVRGSLEVTAQTRKIAGKSEIVAGTVTLKSRQREKKFPFSSALTMSFREKLGNELLLVPHQSPTEVFLAMDAGSWKPDHVFVVDRELLPVNFTTYRAWLYDGQTIKQVGSAEHDSDQVGLQIRFDGHELSFAKYDFGPHLPNLSELKDDPSETSSTFDLKYVSASPQLLSRIGYATVPFPTKDTCPGYLLE